jgi:hypothetical protein
MKWEHELEEALRAVARASDEVPANPDTEQALLAAFDARRRPGWQVSRFVSRHRFPGADVGAGVRWVLPAAAAAALVLLMGGWWELQQSRGNLATPVPEPSAHQAEAVGTASSVLDRSASPVAQPPAPAAAPVRPPAVRQAATNPRSARVDVRSTSTDVGDDQADEFVTLPAAERLPPMESGMVVRVELPVTSLPAYGFPIMPDSGRRPVTADVLVGQDGQPRAIRLVAVQTGTGRR